MTQSESEKAFIRHLDQKLQKLKKDIQNLFSALVGNNQDKKIACAKEVSSTLSNLKESMASSDFPNWAQTLLSETGLFLSNPNHNPYCTNLATASCNTQAKLTTYTWPFTQTQGKATDFSNFFPDAYNQSEAPALFDKLISQLNDIINSGFIDSISALNTLEDLIANIQENINGDPIGIATVQTLVRDFSKNYALVLAKSVPVLGGLVEAAQKTANSTDVEIDKVFQKTHDALSGWVAKFQSKYRGNEKTKTLRTTENNIKLIGEIKPASAAIDAN